MAKIATLRFSLPKFYSYEVTNGQNSVLDLLNPSVSSIVPLIMLTDKVNSEDDALKVIDEYLSDNASEGKRKSFTSLLFDIMDLMVDQNFLQEEHMILAHQIVNGQLYEAKKEAEKIQTWVENLESQEIQEKEESSNLNQVEDTRISSMD